MCRNPPKPIPKLIYRSNEIAEMTGLSMSTITRMEAEGAFPKRRKLSKRAMGWLVSEVDEWRNTVKHQNN